MAKKNEKPTTRRPRRDVNKQVNVFKKTKGPKDKPYKVWYYNYYYEDEQQGKAVRSNNYSTFLPVEHYSRDEAIREAVVLKAQREEDRQTLVKDKKTNDLLFSNYTKGFFSPGGRWYRQKENAGKEPCKAYLDNLITVLNNEWLPKLKNKDIRKITTADLEKIQEKWQYQNPKKDPSSWGKNAKSGRTLNQYIATLSIIFEEARKLQHIEFNPCKNLTRYRDKARAKKVLQKSEQDIIFRGKDSINELFEKNFIVYSVCLTALLTGMRQSELLGLRVKDIDFDKRLIHLCGAWDHVAGHRIEGSRGNKQHERLIPLFRELIPHLKRTIISLPGTPSAAEFDNRFLFSYTGEKPLSSVTVGNYFKRAVTAGLKLSEEERKSRQITFHSLRHVAKSHFMDITNGNSSITNLILGHSSQEVADRYDQPLETRLEKLRRLHDGEEELLIKEKI